MKTNYNNNNNLLTNLSEYGKHCGLCHKNKSSRQYYKMIDGKQLKICNDCWNLLEEKRRSKSNNEKD